MIWLIMLALSVAALVFGIVWFRAEQHNALKVAELREDLRLQAIRSEYAQFQWNVLCAALVTSPRRLFADKIKMCTWMTAEQQGPLLQKASAPLPKPEQVPPVTTPRRRSKRGGKK